MNPIGLVAAIAITALMSGCANPKASNTQYGNSALTSATRTIEANIVSKRAVTVDTSRGTGAAAGGALGAIGGSSIGGSGRDNLAGAVVGAVAGAAVGALADSTASTISAYEYIIKSDVAGLLTIVQVDDTFSVGDKVFVILGTKPVIVAAGK